jgi:FHS family L-fucose permease-like MFS transporter
MSEGDKLSIIQPQFIYFAIAFAVVAVILFAIKLPVINDTEDVIAEDGSVKKSAWSFPHLILGTIAIFMYVGAEVSIGGLLPKYLTLDTVMGYSPEEAGKFVAFYWGGAMVGRLAGVWILQKFKDFKVLGLFGVIATLLVAISVASFGSLAMWALIAVGLFNSIMWPAIFGLAIKDLGKHTKEGSGLLCTMVLGGAIVPLLLGKISDVTGNFTFAVGFIMVCYIYITFYALKGSKIRT